MYTTELSKNVKPIETVEDPELVAAFEARVAADEFIEPKDWMPDAYRKTLVRQISQHAHSEIVGMLARGQLDHPGAVAAPQGDPAGQGSGRGRARSLPLLRRRDARHEPRGDGRGATFGQGQVQTIFNYPTLTWADIGAIGWLVDGAAIMNQVPLQRTSYGPYARAMVRVCKEESFHQRQGYEIMIALANGTADQKRMAQDALEPLVVAVADDVRPARREAPQHRAVDALADQARNQ